MGWKVSGTLVPTALLLASATAHAQCTKDTDCKGDRVCEAGVCAWPAAGAPEAPGQTPADGASGPAAAVTSPAAPTPSSTDRAPDAATPATPVASASRNVPVAALAPLGQDEPALRRRSKAAMTAGIIMISVGPIALLGALAAKRAQDSCDSGLQADYPDHVVPTSQRYRVDDCNGYSTSVYALGIGGALLTAAGIPLLIYGSKNVPTRPASASLRLVPWASATARGLTLRFAL